MISAHAHMCLYTFVLPAEFQLSTTIYTYNHPSTISANSSTSCSVKYQTRNTRSWASPVMSSSNSTSDYFKKLPSSSYSSGTTSGITRDIKAQSKPKHDYYPPGDARASATTKTSCVYCKGAEKCDDCDPVASDLRGEEAI